MNPFSLFTFYVYHFINISSGLLSYIAVQIVFSFIYVFTEAVGDLCIHAYFFGDFSRVALRVGHVKSRVG